MNVDENVKDDVSKVGELLAKLGPEQMLDVIATLSGKICSHVKERGDGENAERWRLSADAIRALACNLAHGGDEEDDDFGDEDDLAEDEGTESEVEEESHVRTRGAVSDSNTEPPPERPVEKPGPTQDAEANDSDGSRGPRKPRMKLVAGHFRLSPKVTLCRLRRVIESGDRGELVGRENDRGFEETEWKVEAITAERLRDWFGAGRYQFEWYGEAEKGGGRVPLGRTQPFRIYGPKNDATPQASPAPAPSPPLPVPPPPSGMGDAVAMMRLLSEMHERERQTDREERRFREELASKERIAQIQSQAQIAEASARPTSSDDDEDDDDDTDLEAKLEALVEARLGSGTDGDDDMPKWLGAEGGQLL